MPPSQQPAPGSCAQGCCFRALWSQEGGKAAPLCQLHWQLAQSRGCADGWEAAASFRWQPWQQSSDRTRGQERVGRSLGQPHEGGWCLAQVEPWEWGSPGGVTTCTVTLQGQQCPCPWSLLGVGQQSCAPPGPCWLHWELCQVQLPHSLGWPGEIL